MRGADGTITVPVPAFLIEHPKGLALFDSGLPLLAQTDPATAMGEQIAKTIDADFSVGEDIKSRLEALDIDVAKIDFIVNSHLHFDHCGGNHLIPNATQVVQMREWVCGRNDECARANALDTRYFDLGHHVMPVDGEHDLFGDGAVTLLPTFGHTPGHQSVRVRLASGDVVLTADCAYFHSVLDTERLPEFGADLDAQRESLVRLRRLRAGGAKMIFGHDPADWDQAQNGVMRFS